MKRKWLNFVILASLFGALLSFSSVLNPKPVEAQSDLIPPICSTLTSVVRTCVPVSSSSACGGLAGNTIGPSNYTYGCNNAGEEVTVDSCDATKYDQDDTTLSSPISPTRICVAKTTASIQTCMPADTMSTSKIYEVVSGTTRFCLGDLGAPTLECPQGYVKLSNYEGHSSSFGISTTGIFGPKNAPNKNYCLPYIQRPTKCPSPSAEGRRVFITRQGQCFEVHTLTEDESSCPTGYTNRSTTTCQKDVDKVPAACPGSSLTAQQKTLHSLAESTQVGSLLQDVWTNPSNNAALSLYLQTDFSILVSAPTSSTPGKWFVITNPDDVPMNTEMPPAPIPTVCAKFVDAVGPESDCSVGRRKVNILTTSFFTHVNQLDVSSTPNICVRTQVRPTSGCPTSMTDMQVTVNLDTDISDFIPEACMNLIVRPTQCAAPISSGENITRQKTATTCVDETTVENSSTPCPSGFARQTLEDDPAQTTCEKSIGVVASQCPSTFPIFVDATTSTAFRVVDARFITSGRLAIQQEFASSVTLENQRCGKFRSFIPCNATSQYAASLDAKVCAASTLSIAEQNYNGMSCTGRAIPVKIDSDGSSETINDPELIYCFSPPSGTITCSSISGTADLTFPPNSTTTTGLCVRVASIPRCPTGARLIDVEQSDQTITTPISGTLQKVFPTTPTLPDLSGNRCFQDLSIRSTCPSMTSLVLATRRCIADGISVNTFKCSGTQTFFDVTSNMCVTKTVFEINPSVPGDCPSATTVPAVPEAERYPVVLGDSLCGRNAAVFAPSHCQANQFVVTVTDETSRCYVPSGYICENQPKVYFIGRVSSTVQINGVDTVINKQSSILCVVGTNLRCSENFVLVNIINPRTPKCRPLTGTAPNEDAMLGSCADGLIPLSTLATAVNLQIQNQARTTFNLVYPADFVPMESDPNIVFCVEIATPEGSFVCDTGKIIIDTDEQDINLMTPVATNGIPDTCFDVVYPTTCGMEGDAKCEGEMAYTETMCATGRTLISAQSFYSRANHNLCAMTVSGESPTGCTGGVGLEYLTKTSIATTPFLDSTNTAVYNAAPAPFRQASKDGACGRFIGIASCTLQAGAEIKFFGALTSGGVTRAAGCYEVIARPKMCIVGLTAVTTGGVTKCRPPQNASTKIFLQTSCSELPPLPSSNVFAAPNSIGEALSRGGRQVLFVGKPFHVRFTFRNSISCGSSGRGIGSTVNIVGDSVLVQVSEQKPFVDASPIAPLGLNDTWVKNPALVGVGLGIWECAKGTVSSLTDCAGGNLTTQSAYKEILRRTYNDLYTNTNAPWRESFEESKICFIATPACQTVEGGSGNPNAKYEEFSVSRPTWYKVTVRFAWRLEETTTTTDTSTNPPTVTTSTNVLEIVSQSVEEIIQVGEGQATLRVVTSR